MRRQSEGGQHHPNEEEKAAALRRGQLALHHRRRGKQRHQKERKGKQHHPKGGFPLLNFSLSLSCFLLLFLSFSGFTHPRSFLSPRALRAPKSNFNKKEANLTHVALCFFDWFRCHVFKCSNFSYFPFFIFHGPRIFRWNYHWTLGCWSLTSSHWLFNFEGLFRAPPLLFQGPLIPLLSSPSLDRSPALPLLLSN